MICASESNRPRSCSAAPTAYSSAQASSRCSRSSSSPARRADLGIFYNAAVAMGAALFLRQQHLIRNREPAACFDAFLNSNWVGAVVFAGIVIDYHAS